LHINESFLSGHGDQFFIKFAVSCRAGPRARLFKKENIFAHPSFFVSKYSPNAQKIY